MADIIICFVVGVMAIAFVITVRWHWKSVDAYSEMIEKRNQRIQETVMLRIIMENKERRTSND